MKVTCFAEMARCVDRITPCCSLSQIGRSSVGLQSLQPSESSRVSANHFGSVDGHPGGRSEECGDGEPGLETGTSTCWEDMVTPSKWLLWQSRPDLNWRFRLERPAS